MTILETERLILRKLTTDDAPFILDLLNQPSFIQYIGDKGVRTLDDARRYILNGSVASYERYGFGLYLVLLKDGKTPIGMCGLIKRDALADVDVGFAFLPQFWLKGYAFEAASAVVDYGKKTFSIQRVVGITTPENAGSMRVLEKLGLRFEKMVKLSANEPELKLFSPPE